MMRFLNRVLAPRLCLCQALCLWIVSCAGGGNSPHSVCPSLEMVWTDVRANCTPTEVKRIENYMGDLVYRPQKTWPPRSCTMDWLRNRTAAFLGKMGQRMLMLSPKCNLVAGVHPNGTYSDGLLPLPANIQAPPMRAIYTFRSDMTRGSVTGVHEIAGASDREGYECFEMETVATTYKWMRGQTWEDDVRGSHITPQLAKNRPLIPRDLWDDPHVHRGGVLLPLKLTTHFGPVFAAVQAEQELLDAGVDISFRSRSDIAFWRGQGTFGPDGAAALQPLQCDGHTRRVHGARGAPGDFFRTGLPHECSILSDDVPASESDRLGPEAMAICERLSERLPGKDSRIDLVLRWGTTDALKHGVDVAFVERFDFGHGKMLLQVIRECNETLGSLRMTNESTPISKQISYKYLISASGMDKATNLNWLLWTDSVPLMPPPSDESWLCEGWLKPWVHYVPLRPDFADLGIRLKWLRANPVSAAAIAGAGRKFLVENFGDFSTVREKDWLAHERQIGFWVVRLYAAHIRALRSKLNEQTTPQGTALQRSGRSEISTTVLPLKNASKG